VQQPRRQLSSQRVSVTEINSLSLFKEIILACIANHMKHINTFYEENTELLNVKAGDTCFKMLRMFEIRRKCNTGEWNK
jgi:hypothetical protein